MTTPEFTFTVLFLIATITTTTARNIVNVKRLAAELNLPDLPQPDPKSHLLLPSDLVKSISNTVIEIDPETDDFQADLPLTESKQPVNRPFTTGVVFRPINRRFPVKRPYRFRLPSGGCHHHHHEEEDSKKSQVPVMGHGTDMVFGDDMILPRDEDKEPVRDAMKHQILPGRVVRVKSHRHGEMRRFPFKHGNEALRKERLRRKHKRAEGRNGNGNGFVKRIRKFLGHF